MIKLYLYKPTYFGSKLLSLYPDIFTRVNSFTEADLIIANWLLDEDRNLIANKFNKDQRHKIVYVNTTNARKSYWEKNGVESLDIRHGVKVDSKILKQFKPITQGLSFSMMDIDLLDSKTIGVPISYTRPSNISQPTNYFTSGFESTNQNRYHNKIYWRGAPGSHEVRSLFIEGMKQFPDKRVDIAPYTPVTGTVYGKVKPPASGYTDYFNTLHNSDIALQMRGDMTWAFTFLDVLRAGCIPCFINTEYHNLGWEQLGLVKEEMFISFDIFKHSPEFIYSEMITLLEDRERVLYMKQNVHNFFKKYIMSDRDICNYNQRIYPGWMDFYAAKLLEYFHNDYKVENLCLFSKFINKIKTI
jgi:hypothetical protein